MWGGRMVRRSRWESMCPTRQTTRGRKEAVRGHTEEQQRSRVLFTARLSATATQRGRGETERGREAESALCCWPAIHVGFELQRACTQALLKSQCRKRRERHAVSSLCACLTHLFFSPLLALLLQTPASLDYRGPFPLVPLHVASKHTPACWATKAQSSQSYVCRIVGRLHTVSSSAVLSL